MNKLFISYSSHDKETVRNIAVDLRANGFDVWLDEWEIKVGECIVSSVERGIDEADFVILVLSKSSVKSGWVESEWRIAYWDQISDGRIRVLPVLIEDCQMPGLIKTSKYADFRKDYGQGLNELVRSLRQYAKSQSLDATDMVRLASYRYKWQATDRATAFKYVMEREGLEHFSEYKKGGDIHSLKSAITELGHAVTRAKEIGSGEYSKKILHEVRPRIDEMLADLPVDYSKAYSCVMTSETLERIIDCVEEPFKSLLFTLDDEIDCNANDWKQAADKALEYGIGIIKLILDVRNRYDFVSAEEEEVREWMANLLYITGGTPVDPTNIPTLGLNPFSTLGIEVTALEAHAEGNSELASIISRVSVYGIFLEEDFEKRLSIVDEYLDRMDWCEDEGAQEEYLAFLKYALIEKGLDVPRSAAIELMREKAKSPGMDDDVVAKLEAMAEQLSKL